MATDMSGLGLNRVVWLKVEAATAEDKKGEEREAKGAESEEYM